jgi:dienelactone hydrolase
MKIDGTSKGFLVGLLPAVLSTAAFLAPAAESEAGFNFFKAKESQTTFKSGDQTITVWRFAPLEAKGPFPGVVMLYGVDGWDDLPKAQLLYKTVAGKIAEKGFVVHFIHYFQRTPVGQADLLAIKEAMLTKVLENPGEVPDPRLKRLYQLWLETVKDGVDNLRQDRDVDPQAIGMLGLSMGGFLATSLVVEHPNLNIRAVVNAFGGLPAEECSTVRAAKHKFPPLQILAGQDDDIVPEKVQRRLFDLWRETGNPAEGHFYSGVGHVFVNKGKQSIDLDLAMNEALPAAIRFLKRQLQATK